MSRPPFRNFALLGSLALCVPLIACHRNPGGERKEAPISDQGEGFEFQKDEPGLLYVWVGGNGRFQTTDTLQSIEESARKKVRILHPAHPAGGAHSVFVADLSGPGPSFRARPFPRADFEVLGAPARSADLAQARKDAPTEQAGVPRARQAVIYGASWCHPCHQAKDWLEAHGVKVTLRDIDEDESAAKDMRAVMKKAGLTGSSIPVIDFSGTVLLGYSEGALTSALKRLDEAKAKTL